MSRNQQHRTQVADLVLKSPAGKDLEIVSPLKQHGHEARFEVGDLESGETWSVTIAIEESDRSVEKVMARPL